MILSNLSRASTRFASTAVTPATTRLCHSSRGKNNDVKEFLKDIAKALAIAAPIIIGGVALKGTHKPVRARRGNSLCTHCGQEPCRLIWQDPAQRKTSRHRGY